jgi:hypothetical protein
MFFLRLRVIDMAGPMDLEVGMMTPEKLPGDDRVRPATLPAGRYATLTYRNHSMRANRALLDWVAEQQLVLGRREVPAGDLFACRTRPSAQIPAPNRAVCSSTGSAPVRRCTRGRDHAQVH